MLSGDVETGTFLYQRTGPAWGTPAPNNTQGGQTNVLFPETVGVATYTYRAINTNQAVLILTGVGQVNNPGDPPLGNGSDMRLFISDSEGVENNSVEFDISFSTNGATIGMERVTMELAGFTSPFDQVRIIDATIRQAGTNAPVPEDYNPVIDPLRPSRIVPESLSDKRIDFTNSGLGDPSFDFSIQFIREGEQPSGGVISEFGTGLLRIDGSPVDGAVNYTWRRIGGTDTARLVISGSDTTFDSGYTLTFSSPEQGTYIGEVGGDTIDIEELIGRFRVN